MLARLLAFLRQSFSRSFSVLPPLSSASASAPSCVGGDEGAPACPGGASEDPGRLSLEGAGSRSVRLPSCPKSRSKSELAFLSHRSILSFVVGSPPPASTSRAACASCALASPTSIASSCSCVTPAAPPPLTGLPMTTGRELFLLTRWKTRLLVALQAPVAGVRKPVPIFVRGAATGLAIRDSPVAAVATVLGAPSPKSARLDGVWVGMFRFGCVAVVVPAVVDGAGRVDELGPDDAPGVGRAYPRLFRILLRLGASARLTCLFFASSPE
ncbi:hypothetical protein BD413DRAFT_594525 [Trametes elegans]|nr:hypothetical protein BD413DRAFT_594525 [Trametes elegans]